MKIFLFYRLLVNTGMWIAFLIIAFLIIGWYLVFRINYEKFVQIKSKSIRQLVPCIDCKKFENHIDTRSKCDKTCKYNFPNRNSQIIGVKKNNQGVQCECGYTSNKTKKFINCPKPSSIKDITNSDCFIWNKTEAERVCPMLCKKYLPSENNISWTGNYKNTSINTSACECEYYN